LRNINDGPARFVFPFKKDRRGLVEVSLKGVHGRFFTINKFYNLEYLIQNGAILTEKEDFAVTKMKK
jgi:hypothetical protein